MPPSEKELTMYQKSTVLDLLKLLKTNSEPNKTYNIQELEDILMAYVTGLEQK